MASMKKVAVIRELGVSLSGKALEAKNKQLVKTCRALETAQAAKAEAMREHNAGLKDLRAQVRSLVACIETGEEQTEIKCEERFDDRLGRVTTVRLDTGATIDERPMTAEERQQDMFAEAHGADDEPGEPARKKAATKAAKAKPRRRSRS